jgi:inosine/xanthosine triphosphate pyrophosphatase family protein
MPSIPSFSSAIENDNQSSKLHIISAYDDKTAYAQCIFSYCGGKGQEVVTFVGRTEGFYNMSVYICV